MSVNARVEISGSRLPAASVALAALTALFGATGCVAGKVAGAAVGVAATGVKAGAKAGGAVIDAGVDAVDSDEEEADGRSRDDQD